MSLPSLESVSALVGNSASVVYTIGSGTIKSMTLRINKSTSDNSILSYPLSSESSTFTTPALQNGVVHTLQLQQINSDGVKYSASRTLTPTDVPLAPVIHNSVASGDHAISFNVNTGALQGGALTALTFPLFASSGPSHATWSFADGGSSTGDIVCDVVPNGVNSYDVAILGLVNGVEYELEAQSINPIGGSPNSNVVFQTPSNIPNQLDYLKVTPGNTSCLLTFKPNPVPTFDRFLSILIVKTVGGVSLPSLEVPLIDMRYDLATEEHSYNLTGLTNGLPCTVDVAVKLNIGGTGVFKTSAQFIPFTIPGAATSLRSTASNGQVDLLWDAPASNGGANIKEYNIYQGQSKIGSTTGPAVTYSVSGLENGTTYPFTVVTVTEDPNVSPVENTGFQKSIQNPTVDGKPYTASAKPTGLVATPGDESVTLNWVAPTDTGGVPISRYDIFAVNAGVASKIGDTTLLSFLVDKLTNGRLSTFSVRAVTMSTNTPSEEVLGPYSDQVTAYATAAPPAVTGFSVTANPGTESTAASMDFIWTALTTAAYEEASSITGYTIVWGANSQFFSGTAALNSAKIDLTDGLTNVFTLGTSYPFQIKAMMTNPNTGNQESGALNTAMSRIAFKLPAAPDNVIVTALNMELSVDWTPPVYAGSDIRYSTVAYTSSAGPTSNVVDPNRRFTGLLNGENHTIQIQSQILDPNVSNYWVNGYTFARNGYYPFKIPNAPVLTATRKNQSVELNWTVPDDGGFDIAYYNVYVYDVDGGIVASYSTVGDETRYTVSNLTNGNSYSFVAKAVVLNLNVLTNQPTEGADSNTASATPVGQIGVVQNVTVTPGTTKLTLNYTAPSTVDTGMSIVRYMVELSGFSAVDNGMNTSYVFKRPEFAISNDQAYDVSVYAVTKDLNIPNLPEVTGLVYKLEDCIPSGDPIMQSLTLNTDKKSLTFKYQQNANPVKEIYCIATDGPTGADYVVNMKDLETAFPDIIPTERDGVSTVQIPMTNLNPRLSSVPPFPADAVITGAYVFASNSSGISMIQL